MCTTFGRFKGPFIVAFSLEYILLVNSVIFKKLELVTYISFPTKQLTVDMITWMHTFVGYLQVVASGVDERTLKREGVCAASLPTTMVAIPLPHIY